MELEAMIKQCREDSVLYFGEEASNDLSIFTLGLCGESGEFADWVKKVLRGSHTVQEAYTPMAVELIDVLIYLCNIAGLLNIDVEAVYNAKRETNHQRFSSQGHERLRIAPEEPVGEGS